MKYLTLPYSLGAATEIGELETSFVHRTTIGTIPYDISKWHHAVGRAIVPDVTTEFAKYADFMCTYKILRK